MCFLADLITTTVNVLATSSILSLSSELIANCVENKIEKTTEKQMR